MNDREQMKADVELVEKSVAAFGVLPFKAQAAWQHIRARLEALEAMADRLEDRERVAKCPAAQVEHEEDAPFVWKEYLPKADAAIACIKGEQ